MGMYEMELLIWDFSGYGTMEKSKNSSLHVLGHAESLRLAFCITWTLMLRTADGNKNIYNIVMLDMFADTIGVHHVFSRFLFSLVLHG